MISPPHLNAAFQAQNPQSNIHSAYLPLPISHNSTTSQPAVYVQTCLTDTTELILQENEKLRKQVALLEQLAKRESVSPTSSPGSQSGTTRRRVSKLPLIRLPPRTGTVAGSGDEQKTWAASGSSAMGQQQLRISPSQMVETHLGFGRPPIKGVASSEELTIDFTSATGPTIRRTQSASFPVTSGPNAPAAMSVDLPSISESVSQIGLAGPHTGPPLDLSIRLPHTPEPPPFDIPRGKSLPTSDHEAAFDPDIKGETVLLQQGSDGMQGIQTAPYPESLPYGTTTRATACRPLEQCQAMEPYPQAPEQAPIPDSSSALEQQETEPLRELFTLTPLDRTSMRLQEPYIRSKQYPLKRVDMGPIHRAAAITQTRIRLPSLVAYSMPHGHAKSTKPSRSPEPYPRYDSYLPLTLPPVQARRREGATTFTAPQTFSQIGSTGKGQAPRGYQRAASRRSIQVVRETDTESEQSVSDHSIEPSVQHESRYLKALSQRRAGRTGQRGPRGTR
jgi:hypothetical protein